MRKRSVGVLSEAPAPPRSARRVRRTGLALILVVLGTAVGLAAMRSREEGPAGGAPRTRLVSDCDGAISDWLLSVPDGHGAFYDDTQADLIAKADGAIRFHLYYARDDRRVSLEAALEKRGRPTQGRVRWHRVHGPVWPWTRDLFLAATADDGRPVTLLSHPDHYTSWTVRGERFDRDRFASALDGGLAIQTMERIDGGALVVDREHVFLARSGIDRAVARGEAASVEALLTRLRGLWGRTVHLLPVRNAHVSRHADMVAMPAGDRRMVVASAELGARLLASVEGEERERFRRAWRTLAAQAPPDLPLRAMREVDLLALMQARTSRERVQRNYADIGRRIAARGYTCFEVPQVEVTRDDGGCEMTFSYVNVVLDERDGRRTVYMPTYRLPTLDAYAAGVWTRLGFEVVPIDCLAPVLDGGGGIHCLSHVYRLAAGAQPR